MKNFPNLGDSIYVGDLGQATIVDLQTVSEKAIPIYLVKEEDETVSYQLIPNERSDAVIALLRVMPDEPLED